MCTIRDRKTEIKDMIEKLRYFSNEKIIIKNYSGIDSYDCYLDLGKYFKVEIIMPNNGEHIIVFLEDYFNPPIYIPGLWEEYLLKIGKQEIERRSKEEKLHNKQILLDNLKREQEKELQNQKIKALLNDHNFFQ